MENYWGFDVCNLTIQYKLWRTLLYRFETSSEVLIIGAASLGKCQPSTCAGMVGYNIDRKLSQIGRISLVPRSRPAFHRFSVLQATKSWAGPGNKAR